ncbi:MAG: Hsp20/alpha crystallin family protein [Bdellovibrionia bacterium]
MRKDLDIFRRYPLNEMSGWNRDMTRFLTDFFGGTENKEKRVAMAPACDISETDTHYMVKVDLPGIPKDDVKIEVSENQLVISGERKEEKETKEKNRYLSERYYGSFQRSFALPAGTDADKIEASYENGELKVSVPKTVVSQQKTIKIGEKPTKLSTAREVPKVSNA